MKVKFLLKALKKSRHLYEDNLDPKTMTSEERDTQEIAAYFFAAMMILLPCLGFCIAFLPDPKWRAYILEKFSDSKFCSSLLSFIFLSIYSCYTLVLQTSSMKKTYEKITPGHNLSVFLLVFGLIFELFTRLSN